VWNRLHNRKGTFLVLLLHKSDANSRAIWTRKRIAPTDSLNLVGVE
jgi:hypothetical protein